MHQRASFLRIIYMVDYQQNLIEPPSGLLQKIMARIQAERRLMSLKKRIIIFSLILIISLVGVIFISKITVSAAHASGFVSFLSLIFSDLHIVLVNWQTYSLTLLESFPVFGVMGILAAVLILMESLKYLVEDFGLWLAARHLKLNS